MGAIDERPAKPDLASMREELAMRQIAQAVREWRKAGKPRKR